MPSNRRPSRKKDLAETKKRTTSPVNSNRYNLRSNSRLHPQQPVSLLPTATSSPPLSESSKYKRKLGEITLNPHQRPRQSRKKQAKSIEPALKKNNTQMSTSKRNSTGSRKSSHNRNSLIRQDLMDIDADDPITSETEEEDFDHGQTYDDHNEDHSNEELEEDDAKDEEDEEDEIHNVESETNNESTDYSGAESDDPIAMMMRHLASRAGITINARGSSQNTLAAKFSNILSSMKSDDPSVQFMAVQELNDVLSMSTEETIGPGSGAGFSAEPFIQTLVGIISGESNALGVENPELQLLGCRCIANLLEALPLPSTRNSIADSGLISTLCMKLASIEYIDVAEQSISLLAKLASEHKKEILENGGLTAMLSFLDFFPINVQRTAVQCAANLLNQIPSNQIALCVDSSSILSNLLSYSDQKIVEETATAICNICSSIVKHGGENCSRILEQVLSESLINNLIPMLLNFVNGSSSDGGVLISNSAFVNIIKMMRQASSSSRGIRESLLKARVGDLLVNLLNYNTEQATSPSDQMIIFLDFVTSLLPETRVDKSVGDGKNIFGARKSVISGSALEALPKLEFPFFIDGNVEYAAESNEIEQLIEFGSSVIPVLIQTFYSSINSMVRVKVLVALSRIVDLLNHNQLVSALKNVSFAQFLARLICRTLPISNGETSGSSEDVLALSASKSKKISSYVYAILVYGLHLSKTLIQKLPDHYRILFVREGVIHELLALKKLYGIESVDELKSQLAKAREDVQLAENNMKISQTDKSDDTIIATSYENRMQLIKELTTKVFDYKTLYENWYQSMLADSADTIVKKFFSTHNSSENSANATFEKAKSIAESLSSTSKLEDVVAMFKNNDSLTSFELLNSGLLRNLLFYIQKDPENMQDFVKLFMTGPDSETPFKHLVEKLNDCLVRVEPFEITFPNLQPSEGLLEVPVSAASGLLSLIRRIRFRLKPDPEIAQEFEKKSSVTEANISGDKHELEIDLLSSSDLKDVLISVPSVASLKSVEEFLLPKLSEYLKTKEEEQQIEFLDKKSRKRSSEKKKHQEDPILDGLSEDDESTSAPKHYAQAKSRLLSERKRKDSSFVHDVDLNDSSSKSESGGDSSSQQLSKMSYSSATTSLVSRWKLELKLGEMEIDEQMSAYGAIHRYETEMKLRKLNDDEEADRHIGNSNSVSVQSPIMNNLYTHVFTIHYKPVRKSEYNRKKHSIREHISKGLEAFYRKTPKLQIPFADVAYTKYINMTEENSSQVEENEFFNVLQFLRILFNLNNGRWKDFVGLEDRKSAVFANVVKAPNSVFVSKKITAKLERQLHELLIVASGLTPSWSRDICHRFGFLLPLETRTKFMHLTAFGTSRMLMKWNSYYASTIKNTGNDEVVSLTRISRQKVRIARDKIFESALKILDTYARNSEFMMEVEYYDEVGTGLGPTLEFYSTISREWQRYSLKMWRNSKEGDHVSVGSGLFPRPMNQDETESKILIYFKALGQFIAKSVVDFRLIDVPLHPLFLRRCVIDLKYRDRKEIESKPTKIIHRELLANIDLLSLVDEGLASSLESILKYVEAKSLNTNDNNIDSIEVNGLKLSQMSLEFSLPGYPEINMKENGEVIDVTMANVEKYIDFILDSTLFHGIEKQVCAFRDGFNTILPITHLRALSMEELQDSIGSGVWEGYWKKNDLMDTVKLDHGFNKNSKQIQWLFDLMCSLDQQQQRLFLQFITGSPKLPIGGFKSLNPPLTVVCRTFNGASSNPTTPAQSPYPDNVVSANSYLPSVMTCVNYLKLPEYSSFEIMKERIMIAIMEGQGSFHLS